MLGPASRPGGRRARGGPIRTRRWACRDDIVARALAAPARNVELKARDGDPGRTLALVLGLGAEDRGTIARRDTCYTCATDYTYAALVRAGSGAPAGVAVVAERMEVCPLCGGCRRRLAELASADTPVYLGRPGNAPNATTMGELLPLAFEHSAGGEEA